MKVKVKVNVNMKGGQGKERTGGNETKRESLFFGTTPTPIIK